MKRIGLVALCCALAGALIGDVTSSPAPRPQEQEAAAPAAAAAGDDDTAGADALTSELAGMRRSLHEISLLLSAALDQQEMSVLMTRIELKQRRLQPLEVSLRGARGSLESVKDERSHLTDMIEMMREEAGKDTPDAESLKPEVERGRKQLDRLAEREATLRQRIIELEDDLARNQEDIATLEEMVDERLGLR